MNIFDGWMQKFLVIQTAFIGDVVLATALLEKIHQHYPDSQIDLLIRKGNEGLFEGHPFLNELLIWNKKKKKYRHLMKLARKIRSKKYDKLINVQRYAATGILTGLSGAGEKIGFKQNPFSFLFDKQCAHSLLTGQHEVERNNELIAHFTDEVFNRPKLYPNQKHESEIANYLKKPFICAAPSSVWFTKQFPPEKWIEFFDQVPESFIIYLLGGRDDAGFCEEIIAKCSHKNVVNLAGKLSFLGSALLMKNATMNYTNDSAPLHFASSVDAPITSVFLSTVPSFGFYPLSTVSNVIETKEPLTCKPCGFHGWKACPLGHFNCAYTISPQQLFDTLPKHG